MQVQDYLRSGKSLEDLTTEYGIKTNICEALGVVSLNYNQINSDMSLKIPQECRGLILEIGSWDIVSRSFNKFFNLDEPQGIIVRNGFNWENSKALVKMDGSLIEMYFYKDQWNISTRGVANADISVGGYDTTFRELVLLTMDEMGFSFDELNPEIWYSFELTTPLNKIVVQYDDYKLTWLAAWHRATNVEIDIDFLPDITAPKVKTFPMTDLESLIKEINTLPPSEFEGVVLIDCNFNRLKIKSLDYIIAFHVVCSVESSPRNKLEVILSDKFDDICGILPEILRNELIEDQNNCRELVSIAQKVYSENKHIEYHKEFA